MLCMSDLGERIKTLRKKRGLTQAQLAAGICTKSFISQIEKGYSQPALDTLQAIAERLGVTLADFFDHGEPTTPPPWMVEAIQDIVRALEAGEHIRALHRGLVTLGHVYEMTGNRDGALEVYRKAARVAAPWESARHCSSTTGEEKECSIC